MQLRFGITMRETRAEAYHEVRDSLARDWPEFMSSAFPDSRWLLIPNIGPDAVGYFRSWDLNVLILTGGDDIGMFPERDETETALLKHAVSNSIPVLAICRGMQVVQKYFKGSINRGGDEFIDRHRAGRHQVEIGGTVREVNSYHTNLISDNDIPVGFKILAYSVDDGSVEAYQNEHILAMMWHPEREEQSAAWNMDLIINFLNEHR